MQFRSTPLSGAYLIDLEKHGDHRGFFARLFCQEEFKQIGLNPNVVQVNNQCSTDPFTLRGLHYQLAPQAETKLVRCLSGGIYDLILDIRPESPTFGQSFGAELTPENRTMMFVPEGFAHALLTLKPNTEVMYLVSNPYAPELERGIRWNDPYFDIKWPVEPKIISEKDQSSPDWNPEYHLNPKPELAHADSIHG